MNWFKKKLEEVAPLKQQFNFKAKYNFSERENKRKHIDSIYNGQRSKGIAYLVLERAVNSKIPEFKRSFKLFAIENGMKIIDLIAYIRTNLGITEKQSLFLIIGKSIANFNHTIGEMHSIYSEPDGFLYVTLSEAEVF